MKKLLFIICALLFITSCSSTKIDGNKNKKLSVKSKVVKSEILNGNQNFSFISKPYRTSVLSFRVGGVIDKFDVLSGTHYRKGEMIASLDPRDFKIRVERTEALYRQAEAEFKRIETLYNKNNISASSYEKAKADYVSAKTAYETAKNELNDTKLIAPFDGYVGEVFIEKFQDVKASQQIITFVDVARLRIETYVPQNIAFNAQNLKNVTLSFDAIPNQEFNATILEVSKNATQNNLSYLLTAMLPNTNGDLLAGMSGKIYLNIEGAPSVIIPQFAMRNSPVSGNFVWVVDPTTSTANRRNITVGKLCANGAIEIIDGLNDGETIVTTGLDFLTDGEVVEIQK